METVEDMAGRGGQHALGGEQVLDRQRNAIQQPRLALGAARIGSPGHIEGPVRRLGDHGVQRLGRLHGADTGLGQLDGRELLVRQPVQGIGNGQRARIDGHHSTTFGTV
jgi:hypothetical protein